MELFLLFSIILTIIAFISIITSSSRAGVSAQIDSDIDLNYMDATSINDERTSDVTSVSFSYIEVRAEAITDNPIPQNNPLQINGLS